MPRYVVDRAAALLNQVGKPLRGARLLLLGVAYKPNVGDIRESPAIEVARMLRDRGADVRYCDPHVSEFAVAGVEVKVCQDPVASAAQADLVLIVTPHDQFDLGAIADAAALVLDTRGRINRDAGERL